jgi:hypothetical protein
VINITAEPTIPASQLAGMIEVNAPFEGTPHLASAGAREEPL